MANEGEKRISRVAVGSERKKNLTRPMRSKHPETPKRLNQINNFVTQHRWCRLALSTHHFVDLPICRQCRTFSIFTPAHTQKRTFPHHANYFSFKRNHSTERAIHAIPHTSGGPHIVVGRCLGTVPFFHQKLRMYIIPFSTVVLK